MIQIYIEIWVYNVPAAGNLLAENNPTWVETP